MLDSRLAGVTTVVFDFYGTLARGPERPNAKRRLAQRLRVPESELWSAMQQVDADQAFETGLHPFARMRDITRILGFSLGTAQLSELVLVEADAYLDNTSLYAGVNYVFDELGGGRGLRLGLCSNVNWIGVRAIGKFMHKGDVDFEVLSYIERVMKPNRRMYQAILEYSTAAASEVLYVGDGDSTELVGAKRAGFLTCRVDQEWGHGAVCQMKDAACCAADFEILTISELPRLFVDKLAEV